MRGMGRKRMSHSPTTRKECRAQGEDVGPLGRSQIAFLGSLPSLGIPSTILTRLSPQPIPAQQWQGPWPQFVLQPLRTRPHCCNLRRPPHARDCPRQLLQPLGLDAAACCGPAPSSSRLRLRRRPRPPPRRPHRRSLSLRPVCRQDHRRDRQGPRKVEEKLAVTEDPPQHQAARPEPSGGAHPGVPGADPEAVARPVDGPPRLPTHGHGRHRPHPCRRRPRPHPRRGVAPGAMARAAAVRWRGRRREAAASF